MKPVKFVAGILLIPSCIAALLALPDMLQIGRTVISGPLYLAPTGWWFLAGFTLWVLLYLMLPRPTRTYVLGHELTHFLWAWLLGIKASQLRVSSKGGSVRVAENHFLISLAPYFFPLYTLLVLLLRFILNAFCDTSLYEPFWFGFLGLTWAFHVTFTGSMLKQRQPDIQQEGHLFSYAVILLLNTLGIGLLAVCMTPATLEDYIQLLVAKQLLVFSWEHQLLFYVLNRSS
ncbi:MAG: hypothetical protein PHP44_13300 [Kiritimatiellae bacterium]|nr:hypothetical protein [Kiritimatiellia bacterium]